MATTNRSIDEELFGGDKGFEDYFQIVDNIRAIYLSDGSLVTLLDFERVLDDLGVYAFKNWEIGELMSGPNVKPYTVACIFMWPEDLMPDPRGARRLLPFDCKVKFKRTVMRVPIRIEDPSDYRPGTHKAKLADKKIWLVEITMPKNLISDIKTGSIELEDDEIDIEDLEKAYEMNLDQQMMGQGDQSGQPDMGGMGGDMAAPGGAGLPM